MIAFWDWRVLLIGSFPILLNQHSKTGVILIPHYMELQNYDQISFKDKLFGVSVGYYFTPKIGFIVSSLKRLLIIGKGTNFLKESFLRLKGTYNRIISIFW